MTNKAVEELREAIADAADWNDTSNSKYHVRQRNGSVTNIIHKCAAVCEEQAISVLNSDGNTLQRAELFLFAKKCKQIILSVLKDEKK